MVLWIKLTPDTKYNPISLVSSEQC